MEHEGKLSLNNTGYTFTSGALRDYTVDHQAHVNVVFFNFMVQILQEIGFVVFAILYI